MAADKGLAIDRIIMLILLCYPVLLLTVKGGMNGAFFLLLIVSLFYLFRLPKSATASLWDNDSRAFAAAMASPVLAVFLSQAYHGEFVARAYDGPSRFLLAVPLFLALRQMQPPLLTVLQYSFPLGALAALLSVIIFPRSWQDGNLQSFQFSNHIHFGDTALMLGFLSLLSINWVRRDSAPILLLKACGLLAGLYLSGQSGARGGWVAIPVFLFVWLLSRNPQHPWRKLAIAAVATLLAAALSYALLGTVQHRLDMIYQDLAAFSLGQKDTSIGIRLQLWQAALHLFLQNPVFGVGPAGFAQMMGGLSNSGMLTPEAASFGRAEVHNEILSKAVGLGMFGLLSILSVYAVPLAILMRSTAAGQAGKAAFMGIAFVAGFLVFGLTVEIFNLKVTAAFYSLTVAVLLAAATHRTTA